jgi:signal transduction histidine kinase
MSLVFRAWLIGVLMALACGKALAAGVVTIADTAVQLPLNPQAQWWQPADADAPLVAAQAAHFVPAPRGPGYGLPTGPVWFRVLLRNEAAHPRDFLFEVAFGKIDHITFHRVHSDGRVDSVTTGELHPRETRPVPAPTFLFPLSLAAGEQATVYLRVDTAAVLNVPMQLHDERAFIAESADRHAWMGLFYGLVLGLLAYNAYLFRATREMAFLYYVTGGVLALAYFLSVDGLLAAALPGHPRPAQWLLYIGASLSAAFTLAFSRMFLETSRVAPRVDRGMLLAALAAVLVALLVPFVPAVASVGLTVFISLLMAALMTAAGVLSWRAGFAPARWFMLAIGVHLVVLLLVALALPALVPLSFDTVDALHRSGFVINLLCFTLAIGDRIRMLGRQARAAEERAIAAAADVRARNAFLSRMSHELRTPMTGVLGMAELLEHTELTPVQRRYLGTLRYSGDMLLTLINDVLDHARMLSGRLQLSCEAFDLLRLVDECRALFAQQPRDNGVVLHVDIGAGVSRIAHGDAQRLRQVLVNVLAQAFRQTRRGNVQLRLRDAGTRLRIEVDAGSEGGEQARELLAEEGEQGRGTLGLGISRRLVEAMGGRIGIEAVPGAAGTRFCIELPLNSGSPGD